MNSVVHEPIFTRFLASCPLCHSRGIATSAGTAGDHQHLNNCSHMETHGVSAQQPALPELRRAGKERSRAKALAWSGAVSGELWGSGDVAAALGQLP